MIELATQYEFICAWNTGRGYTQAGQRIGVWAVRVDGEVRAFYMKDYDRWIDYHFIALTEPMNGVWDKSDVRSYVMHCYDKNVNEKYPYQFAAGSDLDEARMRDVSIPTKFEAWAPFYL